MQSRLTARLVAALLAAAPFATVAQSFPAKPVRWIVPFPPGGGTDVISRTIAQKLSEAWGQQVVADNRPGGGGTIGLSAAVKSPADGYTIVLGQNANIAIAPALYSKLPYDPVKELAPVTLVLSAPLLFVAHPSMPARNAKELITLARTKPKDITYGSPGNGTTGHLAAEMLKTMAGINITHIPYKGASQAITDLVGGQISIYVSSIPPAMPLLKSGRLKALGVSSIKRSPLLADVPTIAESGVPGYDVTNWYGVFYPAGVAKDIMAKTHSDIVKILHQPEVKNRFVSEAGDVGANTPEQFAAFIKNETAKWGMAVKDSGARVD